MSTDRERMIAALTADGYRCVEEPGTIEVWRGDRFVCRFCVDGHCFRWGNHGLALTADDVLRIVRTRDGGDHRMEHHPEDAALVESLRRAARSSASAFTHKDPVLKEAEDTAVKVLLAHMAEMRKERDAAYRWLGKWQEWGAALLKRLGRQNPNGRHGDAMARKIIGEAVKP